MQTGSWKRGLAADLPLHGYVTALPEALRECWYLKLTPR